MNVMVFLNDGHVINPSFDPSQKEEVIGYYTIEYWKKEIKGFAATLEDGSIVKVGA